MNVRYRRAQQELSTLSSFVDMRLPRGLDGDFCSSMEDPSTSSASVFHFPEAIPPVLMAKPRQTFFFSQTSRAKQFAGRHVLSRTTSDLV